jgi:hypothetical protein
MSDAADPLLDDDTSPAAEAAAVERKAHELLAAAFGRGSFPVFPDGDDAALEIAKKAADRLVQLKLARFADEGRTEITVSNAGRYWAMHGGYLAFLKEEPTGGSGGGGGRSRNPEFEALRFSYMKMRLSTFRLSLGISVASFIISILSVMFALITGQHLR